MRNYVLLLILMSSLIFELTVQAQDELELAYVQWSPFPDIISAKTLTEIVLFSPELKEIDRWQIADDSDDSSILYYAWSPDGSRLAVMLRPNAVQLWNTATRQRIATIPDSYPTFLEWSYDSQYLAVKYINFPNDEVWIIEGDDGDIAYEWSISTSTLTWHPQTLQLATIRESVELWDVSDFPPQPIAELPEAYSSVGLAYSPAGDRIVFGPIGEYENLGIYDTQTLQRVQTLNHTDIICCVSWGNAPLTAWSVEGGIRVWNPDTGQPIMDVAVTGMPPAGELAYLPSWNPDGTAFVYNDVENGIHIRDGQTGEILARLCQSIAAESCSGE